MKLIEFEKMIKFRASMRVVCTSACFFAGFSFEFVLSNEKLLAKRQLLSSQFGKKPA